MSDWNVRKVADSGKEGRLSLCRRRRDNWNERKVRRVVAESGVVNECVERLKKPIKVEIEERVGNRKERGPGKGSKGRRGWTWRERERECGGFKNPDGRNGVVSDSS